MCNLCQCIINHKILKCPLSKSLIYPMEPFLDNKGWYIVMVNPEEWLYRLSNLDHRFHNINNILTVNNLNINIDNNNCRFCQKSICELARWKRNFRLGVVLIRIFHVLLSFYYESYLYYNLLLLSFSCSFLLYSWDSPYRRVDEDQCHLQSRHPFLPTTKVQFRLHGCGH